MLTIRIIVEWISLWPRGNIYFVVCQSVAKLTALSCPYPYFLFFALANPMVVLAVFQFVDSMDGILLLPLLVDGWLLLIVMVLFFFLLSPASLIKLVHKNEPICTYHYERLTGFHIHWVMDYSNTTVEEYFSNDILVHFFIIFIRIWTNQLWHVFKQNPITSIHYFSWETLKSSKSFFQFLIVQVYNS